MTHSRWTPALVRALRQYSWTLFSHDLMAGVTVGLVALPLAMAFAIASGLKPEQGIYCAIVTGFLISALGGSKYQIGGPTGAFVVVVAGIVSAHGVDGLYMVTMMAGVMLVVLGITGMGSSVKYLPRPVVIGFTNGIAVLIASTQLRDFFGLQMAQVPSEFTARMSAVAAAAGSWTPSALAFGATALGLMIGLRRVAPRVPGAILALVGGTALVMALGPAIETVGSRFGGIPSGLPHVAFPAFRPDLIPTLFRPALTVALLGAIESLLSAVVADRMGRDHHNPNVELIAQGVANIASPLFGGLPATGAIARTATNIRAGARTPVAGIVHALTLLVVLLAAAPLARFIPMPVLAAILLMVAWNMGEWHEIPKLLRLTRTDVAVWIATFALTVFADLTIAVEVGMALAALTFIRRVAVTTDIALVTPDFVEEGRVHILQDKPLPPYVAIFKIRGPFLFGSADKLGEITRQLDALPAIVILRLRHMTAIDGTGLRAFEDLAERLRASGRVLILCGAREQPAAVMRQAQFHEHIGEPNLCANIEAALARAVELHQDPRPEESSQFTVHS
ncbi:MAG TPA: SulP family inorganic anion transporter [Vicinamibacterales bacterium]|nr:SulP family inorganic anion transporter [Vicinamibacterales bacterium]